jgi:hypothetical protein
MTLFTELALVGVCLAGLYFVCLAAVSFMAPARAKGFLLGFAGTASAHYFELALRIAVGAAFVVRAPLMLFPQTFSLFGWALILTSAGLLALPWRWHQRFAQQVVPHALRQLDLIAVVSLGLGAFVLVSVAMGHRA